MTKKINISIFYLRNTYNIIIIFVMADCKKKSPDDT